MNTINFLREAGVVAATTIGAGMFGLPYVFLKSGWVAGLFYLFVLSFIVAGAHVLYWKSLAAANKKRLLLGMVRDFLGQFWYKVAVFAVITGLMLALVIYLILGNSFIRLFWPSVGGNFGLLLFWFASIIPLFFEKRIIALELAGVFLMAGIIFIVFLTAPQFVPQVSVPKIDLDNFFLPFGVVLFSLAGWTAIEPLFREKSSGGYIPKKSFLAGTFFAAALYAVFVLGIFNSSFDITPDAISGLAGFPFWKLASLGILGIFALWTSYIPIGLEIKNSLVRDLGWKPFYGLSLVILLPLMLVLLGLSDFLKVIGLAGGVFLSLQYILIILVGKRVLGLHGAEKIFYNLIIVAFILAAVYELYYFVIS